MAQEPIISRISIAGHPIHPMLIHFPVVFLLGLVGTDLAAILIMAIFNSLCALIFVSTET